MRSNFDDVGDFHRKFGLHNTTHSGDGVVWPADAQLMEFRLKFLHEELVELEEAWMRDDLPQMFDALIDLVYVAMGTAHLLGLPWAAGWNEVQRANMMKVRAEADGSNSKRGSGFDVVKPPGWTPPDLEPLLRRYGYGYKPS